jgi:hypothetical protein
MFVGFFKAKSTLSDGYKDRDYRACEDIYYQLIKHYERTLTDKRDRTVFSLVTVYQSR